MIMFYCFDAAVCLLNDDYDVPLNVLNLSILGCCYCSARKWENFQEIRTKGAIIRLKAQLVEEGENTPNTF